MPFENLLSCFKKNVGDIAEQYGGETARDLVEDGIEQLQIQENEGIFLLLDLFLCFFEF